MSQLAPADQLSDLQQKILKHVVECTDKNESVSHVSRELNTLQPAVFRSIKSLINEGYVKKEGDYTGNIKLLSLTEKGAAVAFLLAAKDQKDLKLSNEYLEKIPNKEQLFILQQALSATNEIRKLREPIIKDAIEYWLRNNLFQWKNIDTRSLTYFILKSVLESNSELKQPKSIRILIEKYGLDKNFIINALEEKRKAIDLLISELRESDQTAQSAPNIVGRMNKNE
jgi:DNA-binding MarR family transcriptional regulator